ncbi:ROK family transcriptional regulator [Allonocardiopsis opalescens]|uniref:Putative NBD/HSP70 family sugar kinase n=1 Tax=Allonocardiopsis opalescens TaxID=1144618 RepID=A0A2T0PZ47_9ACTN|nr:ROK family transcriptional regulator [Allonocardiopsis opalescens]PRX96798.1 putative NBD/HSP70 family sugar kinase [Allonocardiopsis opalescens]
MIDRRRRTVRDLRRGNRSVLLWQLYLRGTLTRNDLARATGLSAATVSNVVSQLIRDGVVVEDGSVESDGGRPHVLLRVNAGHGHLVGVDVGETRVRVELFDLSMATKAKADYGLDSGGRDVEALVGLIHAGLRAVLDNSGVPAERVLGVGVGVPGVVEHTPEAVVHGQTVGWDAVPLERLLREDTTLPLFIENGAKSMGQAEMWFGAGRGASSAVIALIGSGVGASVVANGATYRGASSSAGEWGHTTIQIDGRACRCGARGCLEAYVGAEAVLDRYREHTGTAPTAADGGEEAAVAALLDTADAGPVLDRTAVYLGAGIADLINLFNPQRIILGGWAGMLLGPRLLPGVRASAARHALRHPFGQTSIELCQLGPEAVALGAATLPMERFLSQGGTAVPAAP